MNTLLHLCEGICGFYFTADLVLRYKAVAISTKPRPPAVQAFCLQEEANQKKPGLNRGWP